MAAKKEVTKKPIKKKVVAKEKPMETKMVAKPGSLSIPMLSLVGQSTGTLSLPKEIFGQEVNKSLLLQALRVYSTNQQAHYGHNKTRGEVFGSTRKIYRQKGTGGARHGAKSAPIFVGGGVTFAAKYRKTILDLPKKMKKAALISAFSQKVLEGEIFGFDGLEKASGKTKEMAKLFKSLDKRTALIINDQKADLAQRAVRNIRGISFLTVDRLNAYEVIRHQSIVFTKAAVERLQKGSDKESRVESPESSEKAIKPAVKKTAPKKTLSTKENKKGGN